MSSERWLPIESNPTVMNSFLRKLGVSEEWEINDVYGLEDELLMMLPQPVLALLLLFPITDKYEEYAKELTAKSADASVSKKVFYMKQTISNACGTVALLHSVGNNLDSIPLKDGALKEFIEASSSKTPEEIAETLEASDEICSSHDDAAREGQTSAPGREDCVDYHFVAFVRIDDDLYELDGRKEGPIVMGKTSKEGFMKDAAKACQEYMKRDPENINFTVLALTAKMI
jgi:ubiquitin carboxyl-terminal hydrolase L3